MRIPSGSTDRYIYFVAVDATDKSTRETGLSSFTVYRTRNNGAAVAMTTPTVNEINATNMPGLYALLINEDTTIGAGNDSEAMAVHITQANMAPVTREFELYRPKTAEGTLAATATGLAAVPTATENADALLTRDWTAVTGEAARSTLNALRINRNRWVISGSTLTVYEEDDTTTAWTGPVTTSASADPITGVDPT